MQQKILRIEQVAEATGISRRTIYLEVAAGRFPRPIQLTARAVGWPAGDVDAWIAARIAQRDGVAA